MQRGLLDPEKADPFSLFVERGVVSYCLYREQREYLGIHGMCTLQDFFEASTPNILARTMETGKVVVWWFCFFAHSLHLLVCAQWLWIFMQGLEQSHSEVVSRFNERFLLSLASCKACMVMDDELNILPISSHVKSIVAPSVSEGHDSMRTQEELRSLKEQLHDVLPPGPLLVICTTLDQGKAVSTFLDAILDKAFQSTIALISSRGRGKSAALGLAIAGAIASGYSRIFVTAPSPENLKSPFDFICRGLHALNYEVVLEPHNVSVDEDLNDGAQHGKCWDRDAEFQQALPKCSAKSPSIVSVKPNRKCNGEAQKAGTNF
ncbi:conserved hypothetical protein [Ricinus communis]|uniref:TcmA/NAT10 helicase domain-containing protein n=1 Tax=Ricinus communis TaxID=3988 RepID=B9RDL3_RICCO|nr:conserved hypothetical protein [Ricinus communis]